MDEKTKSANWKRWAKANVERRQDYRRRWARSNRKKISAYNKRYRDKNKIRYAALLEKWKKANPERWKLLMRRGAKKYRSTENGRLARRAREAARRTRLNACIGKYTGDEWVALKEKYNHLCLRCGKREPEINLVADHVIPLVLGGSGGIDNIQPLCNFCNNIKYTLTTDYRNRNQ